MNYFLFYEGEEEIYTVPVEFTIQNLKLPPPSAPPDLSLLILREKQRQKRNLILYLYAANLGVFLRKLIFSTMSSTMRIVFASFMFNCTAQIFHHYGVFSNIIAILPPKPEPKVHLIKKIGKIFAPSSLAIIGAAIRDGSYIQLGTRFLVNYISGKYR